MENESEGVEFVQPVLSWPLCFGWRVGVKGKGCGDRSLPTPVKASMDSGHRSVRLAAGVWIWPFMQPYRKGFPEG